MNEDRDHYPHCNCYRFYGGRCCWCSKQECPKEPSELEVVEKAVRKALTIARQAKRSTKNRRLSATVICLEDALARLTEEILDETTRY